MADSTPAIGQALGRALARIDELSRCGRPELAERVCRDLLAQFPDCSAAWNRLALLAAGHGNPIYAQFCLERAIEATPADPGLHANLCELLRRAGLAERALPHGERAVALDPRHPDGQLNLGYALLDLGRAEPARAHFERAAALDDRKPQAWFGLARAERALGRPEAALQSLTRCLALAPDDPQVRLMLGQLRLQSGDLAAAQAEARLALEQGPQRTEAVTLLADALMEDGQTAAAESLLRDALRTRPALPALRYRLALCRLDHGEYREGFALYESRTELDVANRIETPLLPMPRWNGEDLRGRSLLVLTEQGYGDHLMFGRFVARIAAQGVRVVLTVSPPMLDLMAGLEGCAQAFTLKDDARRSGCDYWTFVGSLPHRLAVDASSVAPSAPYLRADAAKRARWRERLARHPAPRRIGLVWSGRPTNDYERRRAIAPAALAPLGRLPEVRWLGLQTPPPAADAGAIPPDLAIEPLAAADLGSFDDTAALVAELDLLISVDTAFAHLAGALGRPVWLLLPKVADWRWSLAAETTPWYPTMRIFRQRQAGDWAEVVQRVVDALRQGDAGAVGR
jgi:tetratricopeptide (TPR) repeat protein